jgi:transcriptional accessory protein Tex/SPT6
MSLTTTIDLGSIAQGLGLGLARVESAVRLLDAGNTVPFITRYRKDQTGGLDEEQIREIEARVTKLRLLAERKQTILRSIDSQGKLTPELAAAIDAADSTKRLEDLYLPYKPKKQSLATLARERQLEPFAREILSGDEAARDLDARARDFINPDKQVTSIADVLLGVGHILAEDFSERADLRERLRRIFKKSGKVVSTKIESEKKSEESKPAAATSEQPTAVAEADTSEEAPADEITTPTSSEVIADLGAAGEVAPSEIPAAKVIYESPQASEEQQANDEPQASEEPTDTAPPETVAAIEAAPAEAVSVDKSPESNPETPVAPSAESKPATVVQGQQPKGNKPKGKPKKPEKNENPLENEFRDYFQYTEQVLRVPPHRILALNRGERAKVIRIRLDADLDAMHREAEHLLVPKDHPHADFLKPIARDALARLVIPSLEREIRREMTDFAETHAVDVFAKNLRNLLLVAPVRNRRVMALDPGFKSGCKIAVLDEFGNLLDQTVIHIIGKAERKAEGRAKVVELIKQHGVTVLAIGNGTACRETEEFAAEILANELADETLAYMIVNEAGASVYSTSQLGREEFPNYDATLRGAISIGRRMLDPLSELVKIDPANLGVGLYQHDVKAKHLRASLDAVVESCVNYVGVDLNTASPALLRYVSGLNQLKGRQIYDYRQANGPFKSREQLKEVPGFGEASFVQAAGFLKITDGEAPLDATWIHPESYTVARTVLERLETNESELAKKEATAILAEQVKTLDVPTLSKELEVGELSLANILTELTRPGRDPREDLPPPIFKRGILKLEDLDVGMELTGSVLNVVDFGAFVDIGLHDSGLVHVSQLANKFVRDPHEIVSVGDIVKCWVLEIDKGRRRVSLTMIAPGTKRFEPQRGPRKDRGQRGPQGAGAPGAPQGAGQPGAPQGEGQRGPRPPRGDRPPRQGGGYQGGPNRQGQGAPAGQGSGQQGAPQQGAGQQGQPAGQRGGGQRDGGQRGGPPQGGQRGGDRGARPPAPRPAGMLGPPVEQFAKKFGGGKKSFGRPGGGQGGSGGASGGQGGAGGYQSSRGGGGGRGGKPGGRSDEPREFLAKAKPKPVVPLSDKMKTGKEPLRTFGDLLQFMKPAVEETPATTAPETKHSPAPEVTAKPQAGTTIKPVGTVNPDTEKAAPAAPAADQPESPSEPAT